MGAEEGWWEGAGFEIDFMPESDSPEEGIICVFVCVRKRGRVRESSVNSEGHTMAEGERERQKKRGADLHQRDWICMRKSMMLFCC